MKNKMPDFEGSDAIENSADRLAEDQGFFQPHTEGFRDRQALMLQAIQQVLTAATIGQREVYQRIAERGMSYDQTAQELGISKAAVQDRFEGLRKQMEKRFKEISPVEEE